MISYECDRCGATRMTATDVVIESFMGTREEPAEYEHRCPECFSSEVQEMSAFWCRGCGDVQVHDDGDYCEPCLGEIAEARRDAELDARIEGWPLPL